MEITTKEQIKEQLRNYVDNIGSMNKSSKQLKGASIATISNILAGKWEGIADGLWWSISRQVSPDDTGWITANTQALLTQETLFKDAAINAHVFGIVGDAGVGKTMIAKACKEQENTYLIQCNEYYNRKTFLSHLLREMGRDAGGYTVAESMDAVINHVLSVDSPLIILDEADKLSDQVLYFFITLYNMLEGKCGIVLLATDHLKKRIDRGVALNKKGYKEIYSRLGRKFIALPKPNRRDIMAICKANGVEDELVITEIYNKSGGDLRQVKILVYAEKL